MNTWLLAFALLLLLWLTRGRQHGGTSLLAAAALMWVGLVQVGPR